MDTGNAYFIALAGTPPQDGAALTALLADIEAGFARALGEDARAEWLLSPAYSDKAWLSLARSRGVKCHVVRGEQDAAWADAGETQTVARTDIRSFEAQWLCANADALLAVWNEQAGEMDGAVFEMLSRAHVERLPCVWLSSATGKAYWPIENYYEPFDRDAFARLLRRMYAQNREEEQDAETRCRFMLRLGASLQSRFFKKHAPRRGGAQSARDTLLEGDETPQDPCAARLAALFHRYDAEAIRCGDKYHAVMYWRAILPTVATACLAVGFYSADLTGILRTIAGWLAPLLPAAGALARWTPPAALESALHWLSGAGFLLNAFILYYAYRMSEASILRHWHARYLDSRLIAETYRLLAHFQPYGIPVNLRRVCGRNAYTLSTVRGELRQMGLSGVVIDAQRADEMLDGVEEMLEDQSAYHERSVGRYEAITSLLLRRSAALKRVSLAFLIARGVMQSLIAAGLLGQGDKTGTIANMFAMLLPACAAYYVSKNDTCKYSFHLENHRTMKKKIDSALCRVRELRAGNACPPAEMLASVAETLSRIMILEDASNWYDQVSKASFTQI